MAATQFGPMHSSQDGIDRLEIRIPMRVSRDDIVYIFAQFFAEKAKPTKHEIYEKVVLFLSVHGTDGLMRGNFKQSYRMQQRIAWADHYISHIFSGWNNA